MSVFGSSTADAMRLCECGLRYRVGWMLNTPNPESPNPNTSNPAVDPTLDPVPFPVGRAMTVMGAAVVLLAAGLFLVLRGMGWPVHATQNLIAAGVCGGSGLVGLLPTWVMSRKSRYGAAQGFLVGVVLRMFVAGAVVLAAQWGGYEHGRLLGYWVGGWYLAVLALEVKLVSSFVRDHSVARPVEASSTG